MFGSCFRTLAVTLVSDLFFLTKKQKGKNGKRRKTKLSVHLGNVHSSVIRSENTDTGALGVWRRAAYSMLTVWSLHR